MPDNNLAIALAYYDAIHHKKPELAAEKLADHVEIISPLATKTGKDSVVPALHNLCSLLESVEVKSKFWNKDQVMLTLKLCFPKPIGNLPAASLLTLDRELISNIEMFYDSLPIISKKDEIFSPEDNNT